MTTKLCTFRYDIPDGSRVVSRLVQILGQEIKKPKREIESLEVSYTCSLRSHTLVAEKACEMT